MSFRHTRRCLFIFCCLLFSIAHAVYANNFSMAVGHSTNVMDDTDSLDGYWQTYAGDRFLHYLITGDNYFASEREFAYADLLAYSEEGRLYQKTSDGGWWLTQDQATTQLIGKKFHEIPFSEIKDNSQKAYQGQYISNMVGTSPEIYYVPHSVEYIIYFVDDRHQPIMPSVTKYANNTFVVEAIAPTIEGYLLQDGQAMTQKKAIYDEKDLSYHTEEVNQNTAGNSFTFVYESNQETSSYSVHYVDEQFHPIKDDENKPYVMTKEAVVGQTVDLSENMLSVEHYLPLSYRPQQTNVIQSGQNEFYIVLAKEQRNIRIHYVGVDDQPIMGESMRPIVQMIQKPIGEVFTLTKDALLDTKGYEFSFAKPASITVSAQEEQNIMTAHFALKKEGKLVSYRVQFVDQALQPLYEHSKPIVTTGTAPVGSTLTAEAFLNKQISGYTQCGYQPVNGLLTLQSDPEKNIFSIIYQKSSTTSPSLDSDSEGSHQNAVQKKPEDIVLSAQKKEQLFHVLSLRLLIDQQKNWIQQWKRTTLLDSIVEADKKMKTNKQWRHNGRSQLTDTGKS